MRPFTALPQKVLASLLAVPFLLGVAVVAWPRWAMAIGAAGVIGAVVGAVLVAIEARVKRRGRTPGPLSWPAGPAVWTWALATAVLVSLCAPDLTVKDAGEIGAAAFTLGVPHPTGFSLYCMLEKGLTLLPFGSVFFRITVGSALGMAAAAGLAGTLSFASRGAARFAAAAVALLAAAGPWLHAVTTEVYALSVAGLAATLLAATLAVTRRDARWLALAGFGVGLGTGGHVTWPLEGVVFLVPCAVSLARRLGARVLVVAALALAIGTLVVAYLPIAAQRDPPLNWGDPSSWDALLAHLTGERIRRSFTGQMGVVTPAVLAVRARLLAQIAWESSGFLWPLAALGVVTLARRIPPAGAGLVAVAACDAGFALLANPMGLFDLQTSVPLFLVLAVWTGAGAAWLWERAQGRRFRVVLAGVIGVALAAQFARSPADRDLRHVFVPRGAVSALLDEAPPLSSILTASDDLSAALLAVQAVEGARPDALVLVRPHLADARAVARRVRLARITAADDEVFRLVTTRDDGVALTEASLGSALARRGPLFLDVGDGEADRAARFQLVPGFPAFRWVEATVDRATILASANRAVDRALALGPQAERWGRSYLGAFVRLVGVHLALSGMDGEAIRVTEAALSLDSGDARTWHNLGALHAAQGDLGRAIACLQEAVRRDPGYVRGWRALAKYAGPAGRPDLGAWAADRLRSLTCERGVCGPPDF